MLDNFFISPPLFNLKILSIEEINTRFPELIQLRDSRNKYLQ